ncbi:DNA polymerase IV [Oceanobacter mangrovi]|uniref:DNA polymerase IV n=1 Tax=Oceanobacter mangrovi TaxID=2862510 RepID=UPI001FE3CB2A|nr:DNA polymerase IV [Oceanobacter mangrovi]
MIRQVIHIDCDCFFASVEMRDNPALRAVPLAIGGDPAGRGVVSTCNYIARQYGVRSAMPSARALQLCPSLVMMRGDMNRYKTASRQIMAIIGRYATVMEQVSVDEAYLEVAEPEQAVAIAEQIRADVAREVGVTVSAGVAPNRFLAKVASDFNKPDGLTWVQLHQVDDFVRALKVRAIPGVGPRLEEKLQADGIQYCEQLRELSLAKLIHHYGRMGAVLHDRCRGIDERPLKPERERKSISVERTFRQDIATSEACLVHLPDLWLRWNERLASAAWSSERLQPFVKVKFADFSQTTMADCHGKADFAGFEALLQQALKRQDKKVRLLGIGARKVTDDPAQGRLF